MPLHGGLLGALAMLVMTAGGLAVIFLVLMRRSGRHAEPFHEEGMTEEPWNDGKGRRPVDHDTRDSSGGISL